MGGNKNRNNPSSGSTRSSTGHLGYIVGGLAVADGKLFVGTHDGYVVAFGTSLNDAILFSLSEPTRYM